MLQLGLTIAIASSQFKVLVANGFLFLLFHLLDFAFLFSDFRRNIGCAQVYA